MNKAADAGYHIIILLTGTIEKLRRQTQGRTDEGFVGLDSTAFNKNKDSVLLELEILTVVFLVGQLLLQQVISIHLQQISLVESCLA